MNFESAITHLKMGERIKRSHWKSIFIFLKQNRVLMCQRYRKPWYYNFKGTDVVADDWLIDTSFSFTDDDYE